MADAFRNPFKPGAGHMPPYLAGRHHERSEFEKLIEQDVILENMVLTGLRGVGKTVLLETFKPLAIEKKWLWVGTDLSESISVGEQRFALRILTDLSLVSSSFSIGAKEKKRIGFLAEVEHIEKTLDFNMLIHIFEATPGLVSDKLRNVLEITWGVMSRQVAHKGIIFAYDEAQNLVDRSDKDEYPLSLMLDVFQSLQRKNIPFMLVLTGLPTLFPRLVEARTFAERMFHVVFLQKLSMNDSKEAIARPMENANCPVKLSNSSIAQIVKMSGGYPYFIQFICREVYDVFIQKLNEGKLASVPVKEIMQKLDTDFFSGRWSRVTDRQRDLLVLIAKNKLDEDEFAVQQIVEFSKRDSEKSFSSSHVNQMLSTLCNNGLVYKNRHGKYSFAVPMFGEFIRRQISE